MAEEIRTHLERDAAHRRAAGLDAREAQHAAEREFGGVDQIKERCRDERGIPWLEAVLLDLRYAWRGLVRRPGFTLVAVGILGLGVGANTAVFTLFNAVALRPVPVADPDSVVHVNFTDAARNVVGRLSYPDYVDYRRENRSLMNVAAWAPTPELAGIIDESKAAESGVAAPPQAFRGRYVSDNYFPLLGATFTVGRGLSQGAANEPPAEVVLSDACWRTRFDTAPAVVGRTLVLNGSTFAIVGVAKADVRGTRFEPVPDVWVPLAWQPALDARRNRLRTRTDYWLNVDGRLRPGVTLTEAQAEFSVLAGRLATLHPNENAPIGLLTPATYLSAKDRQKVTPVATGGLIAAAMILLIAGVNLGNLLLFRTTSRQREIAVRLSLGAGPGRIFRQLLTENVLLILVGGATGLLLSLWLTTVLSAALFSSETRAALVLRPNAPVFLYALAACGAMVSLFGFAPAWRASRQELATTLKNDATGFSSPVGRSRLRHVLIVGQTALSLVLLVVGGLLLRTVQRGFTLSTGIDIERTMSIDLMAHGGRMDEAQAMRLQRELADRLGSYPSVRAVALASAVPLQGQRNVTDFEIADQSGGAGQRRQLSVNQVSPEFFHVLGLSLRRGRMFTEHELMGRQPVAIVTEDLARRIWPGADPIGRRLRVGKTGPWLDVIGTIPNTANRAAYEDEAEVYLPFDPAARRDLKMLVRVEGEVPGLPAFVAREVKALDARLWAEVKLLRANVAQRLNGETTIALLSSIVGLLALGLAAAGLYGVLSWMVSQRTREIGVRMALGADRRDVRRMIVRRGLKLVATGVAVGAVAVAALGPVLKTMIYDLSPLDPTALGLGCALLLGAAYLACLAPARRATTIDPAVSLRAE